MAGTTNAQLRIIQFLETYKSMSLNTQYMKSTNQTIVGLVKAKAEAESIIFEAIQELETAYPSIQIDGIDSDCDYMQTVRKDEPEVPTYLRKEVPNPNYRKVESVSLDISIRKW